MTAVQFCYWLQGKLEIDGEPKALSAEQVAVIGNHLNMVFAHDIDPKAGGPEAQAELNHLHEGGQPSGDIKWRC